MNEAKTVCPWKLAFALGLLCLLPLVRLNQAFESDWRNHLWYVSLYANSVQKSFSFPQVFHSDALLGLPVPLFYGRVFYQITGALGALLGSALAVRLVLVGLFAVQFKVIFDFVHWLTKSRGLGLSIAISWTTLIYTLTNVFTRGALPEAFAFGALTVSVVSLIWFLWEPSENIRSKKRLLSQAGLFLLLAVGTHPLTALLGATMLLPIIFTLFMGTFRALEKRRFLGVLGLVIFCVSPWVYAVVKFRSSLNISHAPEVVDLMTETVGKWWVKLLPFPFDPRVYLNSAVEVGTPFLDAQVSLPLIFLVLCLAFQFRLKQKTKSFYATLVMTLLFFVAGVSEVVWEFIPRFFKVIQFGFRLTSFVNLGILLILIFILRSIDSESLAKIPRKLLGFISVLALLGMGVKFATVWSIPETHEYKYTQPLSSKKGLFDVPASMYLPFAYATDRLFTPVDDAIGPRHLGLALKPSGLEAEPQVVRAKIGERLATNVLVFPWSKLKADGHDLNIFSHESKVVIEAPREEFILTYAWEPSSLYSFLDLASSLILFLWIGHWAFQEARAIPRDGP